MGKDRRKVIKWIVLVMAMMLVGIGAAFALTIPGFGKGEKVKAVNGTVIIPIKLVSDGEAHFYRFVDAGKDIGFFVVKGSDGVLHAAFDACDVCFHEKKGYSQQGDFMICRNCNKKFSIGRIGPHSTGGCNPSHLDHVNDGKYIILKIADLKTGARFF